MSTYVVETGSPVLLSASAVVGGGSGRPVSLLGFYVNSTTAGTIVLTETDSGGAAFTGTITPAVGWDSLPLECPNGVYATLGGTISVTFVRT